MTSTKLMSAVLFALLLCASVNAQQVSSSVASAGSAVVPRLVNFSGKATDMQEKPLSGIVGATFAIYKEQYGGAPLWLETQNVQPDSKGNYTVQLGAANPNGLPLDLFSTGEARWLGVVISGGEERARILLLSVPYALKAADAETVGGLPPSAFVLATSPASTANAATPASAAGQSAAVGTTPVTTAGGTVNRLAKFDATADVTNSVIFDNGTSVGIGTATPATTLDVKGTGTVRGTLNLPPTGAATASSGAASQQTALTASAFNSASSSPVNESFRLQAEPAANNTANPSATLNLLFSSGAKPPAETGLKIASNGRIAFASGQTFPGTGTVASVSFSAPVSDFKVTGSPVTKTGTLALNWTVAPTSVNSANAIVKRDSTGSFSAGTINAGSVSAAFLGSMNSSGAAINGTSTGTTAGSDGVDGVTTSASASGVAGINNSGGIGLFGTGGVGVFGTGSSFGMQTDSNVQQARTMGGWVKAMVLVDQNGVGICFNSTLAGGAATKSPCGFNFHAWGPGDYTIDFGFQVSDRFISTTPGGAGLGSGNQGFAGIGVMTTACVQGMTQSGFGCNNTITANQVEVTNLCAPGGSFVCSGHYADNQIYVIVY